MLANQVCFNVEPGGYSNCRETAKPSEELATDLYPARNPLDPPVGTRLSPTPETLEELAKMADSLFVQMPTEEQVHFLNVIAVQKAVRVFKRLDPALRSFLLDRIPSERRKALDAHWGDQTGVTLSA